MEKREPVAKVKGRQLVGSQDIEDVDDDYAENGIADSDDEDVVLGGED